MHNWWENFFHGVALDFWRAVITDDQTRAEADFIQTHLQLPVGAKVLDVPCGNGRLSLALAEYGFQLTGIDIAAEFIEEAKTESAVRGLLIEWHLGDMRDLPWPAHFDGAFCFGNSFGYLDDEGNADYLKAVSRALRPRARFLLDAPAVAECLLPNLQPHRSMEIAGINVGIETEYNSAQHRMFNDFTFTRNGQTDKRSSSQRIYTYDELTALLREAGLEVITSFASLAEDAFKPGAQRLLLVSEKH
jgi:SAM-dependent methyltransferase